MPNAIATIVQQIPEQTLTISERVNTPASAQKLNNIAGAARKKITLTAAIVLPPNTIEASIQIIRRGDGGIAEAKPSSGI